MNTRRTPPRRVEENNVNREIPLEVEQVNQVHQLSQGDEAPIEGQCNDVPMLPPKMSNRGIRKALLTFA